MSGKSRWWNVLFRRREETTTVELTEETSLEGAPPLPTSVGGEVPSAGGFTFLSPESTRPATEPPSLLDTQPNQAVTTGRLKALGLGPVFVPSLAELALLHRVVAQEMAADRPGDALARWQAVLTLCPEDVEARAGAARAYTALALSVEADAAWRSVLEVSPDHAEALAAVSPTELRRALTIPEEE